MQTESEDQRSGGLAAHLMAEFCGRHQSVRQLMKTSDSQMEDFTTALITLEKKGEVYVERHPRLRNGVLRSDIASTDVIYFGTFPSIERKTLLYQTRVEYGDHTINHILGCAHGCTYPCYAMQMSVRYGRVADRSDWMYPRIASNTMSLLRSELEHPNHDVKFVHLSFMTDPFMYDAVNERTYPQVQDLTMEIIRYLNQNDIKVTVLTKGLLPESLREPEYSTDNEYGITLVSLDDEFQKVYEPFSAPASERLKALRHLHDLHLKSWISLEPYPTPNIVDQELKELLRKVSFVDKMVFGRWNYSPEVNGHQGAEKFYRDCSRTVSEFCHQKKIVLHIKHGTPMSRMKSNGLFYL